MGTQIGLFDLAEKRLAWVDQRQALLAQNIANANTPGYQGKDLTPFMQTLSQTMPELARTSARHLAGPAGTLRADTHQRPKERGIDGNAVSLAHLIHRMAGIRWRA